MDDIGSPLGVGEVVGHEWSGGGQSMELYSILYQDSGMCTHTRLTACLLCVIDGRGGSGQGEVSLTSTFSKALTRRCQPLP